MIRILLLLALGMSLGAQGAAAQGSVFWKKVGDWEISIDPTIQSGCFAVAFWNGGAILRIGLNPQKDNFYMLIGNDKWASLQPDRDYDIEIKFDNRAAWNVSARGLQFNPGELVYLHAESTKFDFIEEFMRANRMKITYDNKEIETLKLTGSSRAFKAVMACQEEVDKRAKTPVDPFATKPPQAPESTGSGKKGARPQDPFAAN